MSEKGRVSPWEERTALRVATLGPLGYTPLIPGTLGSAVGVGVHGVLSFCPVGVRWVCISALVIIALWASGRAERAMERADAREIIVDETVGMAVGLLGCGLHPICLALGFLIFRTLDVLKPFPISWVERRLSGPVAVVGDDVLAGMGTLVGLRVLESLIPSLKGITG